MSTNFEDLIMRDTRGNQPAAGVPGRLYFVTDELVLERDNGVSWDEVESVPGGVSSIYLDDLADVNAPSPADGQVLTWDDVYGAWVAADAAAGPGGEMPGIIFRPVQNEPPAANYATLDLRNYHPVLDFDDTTNESAIFTGVLPASYAGGGVTVYLWWMATSDTTATNHVYWDAAFERLAPDDLDLDADSFAAAQSNDTTHVNATSGKITQTTIAFTNGAQMDNAAAGDLFRIQITRDAANDDATGDAELLMVEIRETE